MKKIYSILILLVLTFMPRLAEAHMMGFDSDEFGDGVFHMMGSGWGWLMTLSWIIWITVGILLIVWFFKKLLK